MFSIFKKSRPSITEFIPENFIDIHSHLIPGIDDGAKNMDETVELITKLYSFGIRNFIFTPHIMDGVWNNTPEIINKKFDEVKLHLEKVAPADINMRVAAEYLIDTKFSEILKKKSLLTLKDNYLLTEFSYLNAPYNLYEVLFDMHIADYKPILAHPERYSFFHGNFNEYKKMKEAGFLFQMNWLSLSNYYGKDIQNIALKLLKENMYDFIGSDTHKITHLNYFETITNPKIIKLVEPLLKNNELLL